MAGEAYALVFSCEHGGHDIPGRWRARFAGHERWLESHRGWDRGALACARQLGRALPGALVAAHTSRLLIDLNRPPGDPDLFSSVTRALPAEERALLLNRHHARHWNRVRRAVDRGLAAGPVLHIGVHTFTPVLRGRVRRLDIGLLYDPARSREAAVARAWAKPIRQAAPGWTVALNQPYRGADPGLTASLRTEYGPRYLGLELEINRTQATPSARARRIASLVADCLAHALAAPTGVRVA